MAKFITIYREYVPEIERWILSQQFNNGYTKTIGTALSRADSYLSAHLHCNKMGAGCNLVTITK